MSESRSTRSRWSFAAALALFAVAALVSAGHALALDGVQGKYAIFYPSIDLVYEHTDNLFYTSDNEVSANTFLVRPRFRIEVPNHKHYFHFEYAPTFRDNDEVDLEEDITHHIDLKARLRASPMLNILLEDHFTRGVLEVHEVDPNAELVFGLDPFSANKALIGLDFSGQKQHGLFTVSHSMTDWDRDFLAPAFLEYDSTAAAFEYGYNFRTLTRFLLGYTFTSSTEEFIFLPGVDIDSDENRVHVGFDGEFGRTTTGTVRMGYANRDFDDPGLTDFSGLWVDGMVDKSFTRYTKLAVNVHRSNNFSNVDSHYIANRVSLQLVNQPIGKRVFWAVRAGFQRNDYPSSATYGFDRQDDILRLDGEVGFHPLTHMNFKINYRHEERDSNVEFVDYSANHFLFQVTLGF